MNLPKLKLPRFDFRRTGGQRHPTSLLGLAFEGGGLQGVEIRRTNGSVEVLHRFSTPLALNLLTDEPELVGREIRNQLDGAGIRERRCVACLPQGWALTLVVPLPELPDADLDGFLEIEAERGFSASPEGLVIARSVTRLPGGAARALLVAIPRHHVTRFEQALTAARLRPVSFSLGLVALQPTGGPAAPGLLSLRPSGHAVHVQVTAAGGILALRSVGGAFEIEDGVHQLQADTLARELRITLGQLPAEIADGVRRCCVLGDDEPSVELAEALRARWEPLGISVEQIRQHAADSLPLPVPSATPLSPPLSLAVRSLAGEPACLEFLPPRVSRWQQATQRYASRKLVLAGGAVGALAVVVALVFGIQQALLGFWGSRWSAMKTEVAQLENIQRQIRKYRPWYDESLRSLTVLRRLTEAFPEDGSVTAKSVDIRERTGVTCTGTARDRPSLYLALDRLGEAPEVAAVDVDQIRGRSPVQFTFKFQWNETATR